MKGTTIAHVVPPYVEPGRLEARVSEYYRKLEAALGITPAPLSGMIYFQFLFHLYFNFNSFNPLNVFVLTYFSKFFSFPCP